MAAPTPKTRSCVDGVVPVMLGELDSSSPAPSGSGSPSVPSGDVEKRWELERDLALANKPQEWQLAGKDTVTGGTSSAKRRGRGKGDKGNDLLSVVCAYVVEHQIGLSIDILAFIALTHCFFPRIRPLTTKFFTLSYRNESTGLYAQGWDDMCFVVFWIVVFTGLRAGVMDYILKLAARAGGITKARTRVRFAEQAWLLMYCSCFWSLGMYLLYDRPYWFNIKELWANFPSPEMDGLFKWYYLVQFSFWLQQILVVNIEERRNDYAQMFTHHVFTSALIFASYGSYQTKVGHVILTTMDIVDIILPAAKLMKYLRFPKIICDVAFGVFILTWFVTRHVFYNLICWSIHVDVPAHMPYGCYDPRSGDRVDVADAPADGIFPNLLIGWTDPNGVVCFNERIRHAFLATLLGLQVITLLWFAMIVRVAHGVVMGRGADDSRSDDEGAAGSDDEAGELAQQPRRRGGSVRPSTTRSFSVQRAASADSSTHQQTAASSIDALRPLEEEVGVDKLYLPSRLGSSPRTKRKKSGAGGRTSGISIPGHSDPKDILNRIGCETKTTDPERGCFVESTGTERGRSGFAF